MKNSAILYTQTTFMLITMKKDKILSGWMWVGGVHIFTLCQAGSRHIEDLFGNLFQILLVHTNCE